MHDQRYTAFQCWQCRNFAYREPEANDYHCQLELIKPIKWQEPIECEFYRTEAGTKE